MNNKMLATVALSAAVLSLTSRASMATTSAFAPIDQIHCACDAFQSISPVSGYSAGAYIPGASDGDPACSDYNTDTGEGCDNDPKCNFAGSWVITYPGGGTQTVNIIAGTAGGTNITGLIACGTGLQTAALKDSAGTIVARVSTSCSNCQPEDPPPQGG